MQIKYIKQLGTVPSMQRMLNNCYDPSFPCCYYHDLELWGGISGGLGEGLQLPRLSQLLMALWGVIGSDPMAETLRSCGLALSFWPHL